ncbi:CinA family protein [Lactobacillus terrae]|uniref:CinA family protein n=1 Tax=Lactobacillus terrae TaxID=2269374 RepID=UPI000C1B74DF|nr:CinA family protein [Lactobacillus terrae]
MNNKIENFTQIEKLAKFNLVDFSFLFEEVVNQLKLRNIKITAAESLTSGLFLATVANVPGASEILEGGFVTYSDQSKIDLIGVSKNVIEENTVVSSEVAADMATKSARKMNANLGVGLTGVAGPDPLEGNPVGTVFIGVSLEDNVVTEEFHFTGDRELIRNKSVLSAFLMIKNVLK